MTAAKLKSTSPEKTTPRTDNFKANSDVTSRLNTKGAVFGKCNQRSFRTLQRRPTMRYALNPVDFLPQNGANTTLRPAQLPVSNETLASLSTFCFPGIII